MTPLDGGWWIIHAQMREALRRRLADNSDAYRAEHERWRDHWMSRNHEISKDYVSLAWFHYYHIDRAAAYMNWQSLIEEARSPANPQVALHALLLDWWHPTGIEDVPASDSFCAMVLNSIAVELCSTPIGNRTANLERAIALYQNALHFYTEADHRIDWATTLSNMGNAFSLLPKGDRVHSLQRAIECFRDCLRGVSESENPEQWATIQHNLAIAMCELPIGDLIQNVRDGIEGFTSALRVCSESLSPQDWARTQMNLGNAYLELADRTDDEQNRNEAALSAIACYDAALRVVTQANDPDEWATIQNNLGSAYRTIRRDNAVADVRRSVTHLTNALLVRNETDSPYRWAGTMTNLGNSYATLSVVDGPGSLDQALAFYEASLTVFNENDYPQEWATSQRNIGQVYAQQGKPEAAREAWGKAVKGYRSVNLEGLANEVEGWLLELPLSPAAQVLPGSYGL